MVGLFAAWFGVSAPRAAQLILAGKAPAGMRVNQRLTLRRANALRSLPPKLNAPYLDLIACENLETLPPGLKTVELDATDCSRLWKLPEDLNCHRLILRRTAIESLPSLEVSGTLDLSGCRRLHWLPKRLSVPNLSLRDCLSLEALPTQLEVRFLDIGGCVRLTELPAGMSRLERLFAGGCTRLAGLPDNLPRLTHLDVSECPALTSLPAEFEMNGTIDVAGSGLNRLPAGCRQARLLWRGAPVNDRIAFSPETITVQEILLERNVEVRRVMLERVGMQWFVEHAQAEELDADRDAGGPRRLLRIPLDGEADMVCVVVLCPSTGRRYILRVPARIRTCRQAIAWTAGFDDPDEYQPLLET